VINKKRTRKRARRRRATITKAQMRMARRTTAYYVLFMCSHTNVTFHF